MSRERISIAMCTFNSARFLNEQLESFASQTRKPDELVICDDASTDATVEIIRAFASGASFPVRLVENLKNIGINRNFAKVIGLCDGDIIFLSDADDVWLSNKLALITEVFLSSAEIGGVITDAMVVNKSLQPLGFSSWQVTKFNQKQQRRVLRGKPEALLKHSYRSLTGATLAFRSRFRELVLPLPGAWTHDGWIALIIGSIGKLMPVPEPLNLWRQHEQQMAGSWKRINFRQQIEMASYKDLLIEAGIADRQYHSAGERIAQMELTGLEAARARKLLGRIGERAYHLNKRASMPPNKAGRFFSVAGELMSLRYFLYSSGFKSMASDLFLFKRKPTSNI